MYTLEKFNNMNILLTNSLVIKFLDAGKQINDQLKKTYNLEPPTDYRDWKYFLNISGNKHRTNKPVMIKLVENGKVVELTKDSLNIYKLTKKELLKYDKYYLSVKEEYATEMTYINGCLNPVDIDQAIEAKDGEILGYNKEYIEDNEYNLIRELERYIKNFISRWYISKYSETDSLYIASFLGVLYSSLPNKINNIRLQNINTNRVHSFHLEAFFRSNFNLWGDVKVLNNKSKLWLYKNLRYITTNIGNNKTLDMIISKLYEENNIGVGEYILPTSKLIDNTTDDLDVSTFIKSKNTFISKKLNNTYEINRGSIVPIKSMIDLELKLPDISEKSSDEISYITNHVDKQLSNSLTLTQKTKILDISKFKFFKMFNGDLITILLSNWGYLAINNYYSGIINYIDPNTNKTYNLTPYEGYLVAIKLILSGINAVGTPLTSNIMDNVITLDRTNLFKSHNSSINPVLKNIVDEIDNALPTTYPTIDTKDKFKNYMKCNIDLLTKLWVYCVNVDNNVDSAILKTMTDSLLVTKTSSLTLNNTPATIDSILISKDIVYDIPSIYDHNKAIKSLFLAFTGYNVFPEDDVNDVVKSYASLLNKLTSYTTQVLSTTYDEKIIQIPYNSISVLHADKGYINITDAEISSGLELTKFKVSATANDFREKIAADTLENLPVSMLCSEADFGMAKIEPQDSELTACVTKPTIYVKIASDCVAM